MLEIFLYEIYFTYDRKLFFFLFGLQVREMNLLRESNMQLREENKHNFEECQVRAMEVTPVFQCHQDFLLCTSLMALTN